MTNIDKNILIHYTNGAYNAQDERYVTGLFGDEGVTEELKQLLEEDWDTIEDPQNRRDLGHVLQAIHQQIQPEEKSRKTLRFYRIITRVAAVLLLPLMILFVVKNLNNDYVKSSEAVTTIHAMHGSKVTFTLPDGTKGWLKGGSELSYETLFKQRHVRLAGEAFFDVAHDHKHPFEVIGSTSKIVVLGTRFTADMWPESNTTEVVLESGKVKFIPNDNQPTIMRPGERLLYQKVSGQVMLEPMEAEVVKDCVDGVLVFRGDNLKQVAEKLSEWYHAEVVLQGECPEDYLFRATFKDESIEEVLKLMKLTAPIDYEIAESKQKKLNGRSKIKVTLTFNE